MAYIGNDLAVAYPNYRNIDDISASFNGSTTSFALLINGTAPVPQPLNSQQCLISVGGVLQRPDDTGSEGFRLSGGNIIFSSAPSISEDFFGVVLAGADYVNVGANFPDGQVGSPSITFDQDTDTGFYRSGSGAVSFTSNGVGTATFGSASFIAPSFIPTSSTVPTNGVYLPAANSVAISTNSTERTRIDSSGRLLVGTSTARANFFDSSLTAALQVEGVAGDTRRVSITSSDSGTSGAVFILAKQRSGTIGGNTVVQNNDLCGVISFQGSDGTEFVEAAAIVVEVDGTPGANDMPGRLIFATTADGATGATTSLSIFKAGKIGTGTRTESPYNLTTANAANMHVDGSGFLYRSTSSERFKTSIEEIEPQYSEALLGLRSVWYRSTCLNDNHDWGWWGFIAEEVAEIDPRLVQWRTTDATHDENGKEVQVELETPIADGVQYDRFVPHLLNLIKRQGEAIAELQAEVAALKAS